MERKEVIGGRSEDQSSGVGGGRGCGGKDVRGGFPEKPMGKQCRHINQVGVQQRTHKQQVNPVSGWGDGGWRVGADSLR